MVKGYVGSCGVCSANTAAKESIYSTAEQVEVEKVSNCTLERCQNSLLRENWESIIDFQRPFSTKKLEISTSFIAIIPIQSSLCDGMKWNIIPNGQSVVWMLVLSLAIFIKFIIFFSYEKRTKK